MSPKQAIFKTLSDDAAMSGAGHLGHSNYLGHAGDGSPYGVFFMSPPEIPDFPLITYNEVSAVGRMPRIDAFNFTVWGNNYEAIHELIYDLLHEQSVTSDTGVFIVQLMWNWAGPVAYDENYHIFTRTHRYLSKGVKI